MNIVKKKIRIGIPRTIFYYRYGTLYRKFFSYLGCDIVVSGPTTDAVIELGKTFVEQECLSLACLVGHTFNLVNKCDYIFLPNYLNYGKRKNVCFRIKNVNNFLENIFVNVKFLSFNVDYSRLRREFLFFLKIGLKLKKGFVKTIRAYIKARRMERVVNRNLINSQNKLLQGNTPKVLIVGYSYVIHDDYFMLKVVNYLKDAGIDVLYSTFVDKRISSSYCDDVIAYMGNMYDRELLGSIAYFKSAIDGIIMVSSSNCKINMAMQGISYNKFDKPIVRLEVPCRVTELDDFIKNVKAMINVV